MKLENDQVNGELNEHIMCMSQCHQSRVTWNANTSYCQVFRKYNEKQNMISLRKNHKICLTKLFFVSFFTIFLCLLVFGLQRKEAFIQTLSLKRSWSIDVCGYPLKEHMFCQKCDLLLYNSANKIEMRKIKPLKFTF